jgi:hypothetical protein
MPARAATSIDREKAGTGLVMTDVEATAASAAERGRSGMVRGVLRSRAFARLHAP